MKYVIILILCLISGTIQAAPAIFVDSLEDAIALSENSNRDVLLLFGAEWCGACKQLQMDLTNNSQMSDDLIICHIDIDSNKKLAKEYRVKTIPYYLLIRDKKEIKQEKGYGDSKRFIRWRNK